MSRNVFSNGCFDLLHPGHYNLLTTCRTFAGRFGKVFIAIDSDSKVTIDKGPYRPINSQIERTTNIKSLTYPINSLLLPLVDEVFIFENNKQLYELIKKLKPDLIVKGSDWKGNVIGSDLCEVIHYELQKNCSTTDIESKIISNRKNKTKFDPNI